MTRNFEPHECVTFVQSMKIGIHENKVFHSIIFSLKRVNCIEFCNENALLSQQSIHQVQLITCYASYEEFEAIIMIIKREYLIIFKISAGI